MKEGACRILLEGGSVSPLGEEIGFYVAPALQGPGNNVCCREKIFGPCAYLLRFNDEHERSLIRGLVEQCRSSDLERTNRVGRALGGRQQLD